MEGLRLLFMLGSNIGGIDEAGKGAVFGSLFVVLTHSSYTEKKTREILTNLGVKDSKLLSRSKRIEIINEIRKDPGFKITIKELDSNLIDSYVVDQRLNQLLYKTNLELIKDSQELTQDTVIYIDSFTTPAKLHLSLYNDLKRYTPLTQLNNLIVENKADTKYLITGLASIFAKEAREESIDASGLRDKIGSGYPSDDRVKNYIIDNIKDYKKKQLKSIRYSWKIKL